jgi:hypothetical protein
MAKLPKKKGTAKNGFQVGGGAIGRPRDLSSQNYPWVAADAEKQRLRMRVAQLEQKLKHLQAHFGLPESTGQELFNRHLVAAEYQQGDLAYLYVATRTLHASIRLDDVFAAVREILVNLVGVEEMGVFKNDPGAPRLTLRDWHGASAPGPRIDHGVIRSVALRGKIYIKQGNLTRASAGHARSPIVCVPLKIEAAVWGAVAIFSLLPQKHRLTALDYQLLDLLSEQAGQALYCAELRAERARVEETSV